MSNGVVASCYVARPPMDAAMACATSLRAEAHLTATADHQPFVEFSVQPSLLGLGLREACVLWNVDDFRLAVADGCLPGQSPTPDVGIIAGRRRGGHTRSVAVGTISRRSTDYTAAPYIARRKKGRGRPE
jgi:hypothetical protein